MKEELQKYKTYSMELEIIKSIKVNTKTFLVFIPDYEDDIFHDLTWHDEAVNLDGVEYDSIEAIENAYPALFSKNSRGDKCLKLEIDVETGQVLNWPKNSPFNFYDKKIVDEGEYILLDENGETITEYAGYVPTCVGEGGYGDYLEFEIDSDSNIPEWKFNQEKLNELMMESGNEFYENI